jgi:hypothetical protein
MNLIVFNELNNKIKGTTPKKNKKYTSLVFNGTTRGL